MFEGPVTDRSDRKLWTGIDAMPEKYKQGADGVYRAKDELISDTVAEMSLHEGDYDRQCANKRATRRTAALNETEIRAAQEWGKEAIREKHPELFGGHHEA